jgi:hypothetical protein
MPERDANIKFTRKWNEHYIHAVISGAPIFFKGKEEDEAESEDTGLIISPNCSVEKRKINWGLAIYKLRQGKLVFNDIKDQLVAALTRTEWGPNYLKAIS